MILITSIIAVSCTQEQQYQKLIANTLSHPFRRQAVGGELQHEKRARIAPRSKPAIIRVGQMLEAQRELRIERCLAHHGLRARALDFRASLGDELRVTLVLREVAGLSYQEIADILEISVKSVSVYLARGLKKFESKHENNH